ncbi:hypothetical protein MRX96_046713 [Rhipicephalus microplus]
MAARVAGRAATPRKLQQETPPSRIISSTAPAVKCRKQQLVRAKPEKKQLQSAAQVKVTRPKKQGPILGSITTTHAPTFIVRGGAVGQAGTTLCKGFALFVASSLAEGAASRQEAFLYAIGRRLGDGIDAEKWRANRALATRALRKPNRYRQDVLDYSGSVTLVGRFDLGLHGREKGREAAGPAAASSSLRHFYPKRLSGDTVHDDRRMAAEKLPDPRGSSLALKSAPSLLQCGSSPSVNDAIIIEAARCRVRRAPEHTTATRRAINERRRRHTLPFPAPAR